MRDHDGNRVNPRDHLSDDETRQYEAARRNSHPATRRPRLHILPDVDPETGLDGNGWQWSAKYPRRDER
jgi:hypothetical protein